MMKLVLSLALLAAVSSSASADWWDEKECPRAKPDPALSDTAEGHTFDIDGDADVAVEGALLGGKPVVIVHSGCEVLAWRFLVPLDLGKAADRNAAWAAAHDTLVAAEKTAEFIFELREAIEFIEKTKEIAPAQGEFQALGEEGIDGSLMVDFHKSPPTLSLVLTTGTL